ncbi:hypothetical protein TNCV_3844361 [Trichonephila clavipes]|nr:hypothetical protein TNCV_3844361 [Trichonephila clavipes]
MGYSDRPMPRHGQRSSHNNAILPLLSVDMQIEFPCFSENMSIIKIIRIMVFLRRSREATKPSPIPRPWTSWTLP